MGSRILVVIYLLLFLFCPFRSSVIGVVIFLSFWIWLSLTLSFVCHFGGAPREGGRGRAPRHCRNGHISRGIVIWCRFGVILVVRGREGDRNLHIPRSIVTCLLFWCHFLSLWWGAEGGRAGQGTKPKHFPRQCHLLVIWWGTEGGREGARMTETTKH